MRCMVLCAGAFALSSFMTALGAASELDPGGLKKYLETFPVAKQFYLRSSAQLNEEKNRPMSVVSFDKEKPAAPVEELSEKAFAFFHGKEEKKKPELEHPQGIRVRFADLFRDRLERLKTITESKMVERNEYLAGLEGDIEKAEEGDHEKSAKAKIELADLKLQKRDLEYGNSRDRQKIKAIEKELNDSGKTDKAAALFSRLSRLVLSSCPRKGKYVFGIYECRGITAQVLRDTFSEIQEFDDNLKGTSLEGLQLKNFFGESQIDEKGNGYLKSNFLLGLFGIQSVGCFEDKKESVCQLVTDETTHEPVKDLELAMRQMLGSGQPAVEDKSGVKSVAKPQTEAVSAELDRLKEEQLKSSAMH